jgi:NADP-dependent 3-hydroxy acid dehydrogenase YdfG
LQQLEAFANDQKETHMTQTVLITGAGKGFGRLITDTLPQTEYTVIASMRDINGRNQEAAGELRDQGKLVVEIDVTSDRSVEDGVTAALQQAGQIDILINNAGAGVIGLQESFTIDDWYKVFELNVFGVQRMNRAVLPHMRKRRSGLLIHVSSLLGRFCLPFLGPYNATKFALEAMADNYRLELSGSGIESIIVEPGGFGTDFHTSAFRSSDTARTESYGEFAGGPEQLSKAFAQNFEGDNAPDPQMVADAVLKLIRMPRGERPFRTVVDGLGMGAPIEQYNQAADQMTTGILTAVGMESMLKVR